MIKQITFLLIITIFSAQISSAQRGVRIGYIDMDVILESVDEYKTANLLLDKKVENWKKEIELQKLQLKKLEDALNAEKALLTPNLISDRQIEINDFASDIVNFQTQKFGPRGELIQQKSKLLKPIQDRVLGIVREIAQERKYDFIFDRSSDLVMLYSAKNYDISDLVLRKINAQNRIEDRKEQLKKREEQLKKLKN
ncbi:MAG: OmpH family outer membrane protein [Flavobacteriaceae bacterium]|nr:OmpH family outer membrane protein [Flavobacteriaceae bacterium]